MLQFLVRLCGAAAPPFRGGAERGGRGRWGRSSAMGSKVAVCGPRPHPRPAGGSGEAGRVGGLSSSVREAGDGLAPQPSARCRAPECSCPAVSHGPMAVKLLKRGGRAPLGLSSSAASLCFSLSHFSGSVGSPRPAFRSPPNGALKLL